MVQRHFRLGFAGFGNVGRALARLLLERRDELAHRRGLTFSVPLLASARRGARVEPAGIDLEVALRDGWSSPGRLQDVLGSAPLDLLFEVTPLEPRTGEPALSHMRAALERGVSVVSANKGPIALAAGGAVGGGPPPGGRPPLGVGDGAAPPRPPPPHPHPLLRLPPHR